MKNYLYNLFDIIKKGHIAKLSFVSCDRKKICETFLKTLWDEGFILGYKIETNKLQIFLKYHNNQPAINSIKFLSKPTRRIYYSSNQIWKIDSNKDFMIFSTNQGLKSIIDCKKFRLGGEPYIIIN